MIRKIFSILILCAMLMSCCQVTFADTEASEKMEKALIEVKGKLNVPDELTEFTPYTSKYKDVVSYSFSWTNKDNDKMIEVSADEDGRISSYYAYDRNLKTTKKLTALSKSDIVGYAETFLNKLAPEIFVGDADKPVFDESSWNVNGSSYYLNFIRQRDGIEVKDNDVSINIEVYDDVPYVRNAYVNFDYDAEFEAVPQSVEDYEKKYRDSFPIEMIYKDEYHTYYRKENEEDKVVLVYRYKDNEAGYILASNGEVVTEDPDDEIYKAMAGGGAMMESSAAADKENGKVMLTDKEIEELKEVKGVISQDKVREILNNLPYVKIDNGTKVTHYTIHKVDEKYTVYVNMENAETHHYVSATLDGKSGELISLNNSIPIENATDEKELSDKQKEEAAVKMDEFLKVVAGAKIGDFEENYFDAYKNRVTKEYGRIVNGVRYIDDGLQIGFDYESGTIYRYYLDYEEKQFPKTEGAINSETAYDAMLENAPLKRLYICNDKVFKVCFTASEKIEIDAYSGEKYGSTMGYYENEGIMEYSDVTGHWAEEKINKLAEIQIAFKGEKFNPDEAITQYDLLRLFAAGVRYKSYLDYDEEMLYGGMVEEEILTESEVDADAAVKREDAFVYMIRIAGLDEVAKLSEIFKVEYADGDAISQGKIGYPAILTGMGIICGNGGKVRPQEFITRAEAAVMVYNYMAGK